MEPDFSGIVSAANLKCSDGRVIMPGAFKHQDGQRVPIVYQHNHTDANQVLGYAILKDTEDGLWGDCYMNKDNPTAVTALSNVKFGALKNFSVWAKDLVERGEFVHSGEVQEVSLVLAGANKGAQIFNVLAHGDIGLDEMIFVGGEIQHSDTEGAPEGAPPVQPEPPKEDTPAEGTKSVKDVLDTLTDEQELAVNATIDDIVKEAVTEAVTQAELTHSNLHQEGSTSMTNAFEGPGAFGGQPTVTLPQLKRADAQAVLMHAKGNPDEGIRSVNEGRMVDSLKELVRSKQGLELMHADTYITGGQLQHAPGDTPGTAGVDYGITNIEYLFPDAQKVTQSPTWVDRRQDWVKVWMSGTGHTPFSRVKSMYADITADEARAKGWIKGHMKTDEVFPVFKRVTGPTWVIKKQKLDRQDIIDIVDFDVVAWMKAEMRGKLDEEVARAGLFGDNRPAMVGGDINPDKIKDPGPNSLDGNGIRAVVNDHEVYATTYDVPMAADARGDAWNALLDTVTEAGEDYRGSGNKTAFLSYRSATRLLTMRSDFDQKRIYRNLDEVAGDMDVSRIVRVPSELFPEDVLAIVLDLGDYNYGTNRGGEVTMFDDFDIKWNQYHYLIETYLSGALVLPYSAQIFKRVDATDTFVAPVKPGFNPATGVITIPNVVGLEYVDVESGEVMDAGPLVPLAEGQSFVVTVRPADDAHYIGTNDDRVDTWTFTRPEA